MLSSTMRELKYVTFDTKLGWVGILASARGLWRVTLPQSSLQDAEKQLGDVISRATLYPRFFEDLTARIRGYFSGQRTAFPDRLDLSGASDFQRRVWEETRRIPYGETRSYSWIASQIGKPESARAVGQALGRNPLPLVIPCHRVLGSDGGLCGFGGGLRMKQYLLNLEA